MHQQKGVVLTVCSKNERENAVLGLSHPSGVLKPDDFAVIQANWEAKSENVGKIAESLNILPDSIVFVDDNPAEREIVRTYTHGVAVPEIGEVDSYISTLERNGFFEVTAFSEDDLKRNAMYQENTKRMQAQQSYTDYGAYLQSLEMKAIIRDFEPLYLPRITQLTNKSNQFNVTTKRYTESEMKAIADNPAYIRLYGQLSDRFGDNGIVSVVIGRKEENSLHLDLWLMSCRVLKRDMELAMLDTLVLQCKKEGIQEIYGYYYPTKKNEMVRYLYREFGFVCISEDESGNGIWKLNVSGYQNKNAYIQVEP
ncbi:MAG: HAD family hydrolase, partial [Clostridia bacterium]|nr:HAD family hydrolase [Clostridia bacterium]